MKIDFYRVTDNPKTLVKNLGEIIYTATNVATLESTSLEKPSFLMNYNSSIINSNYLYVDVWNRYYFFSEPIALPGGRMRINCHHDVLMNNASEILALQAYALRGSLATRDSNIIDSNRPVKVIRDCNTIKFPSSPFSERGNFSFVLSVIGGKNNAS